MKKIVLLLLCVFNICVSNVFADNVDVATAERVARLFMTESAKVRNVADVNLAFTLNDSDGMPSVYVFNVDDTGFVLISAENRVKPVLGYSTEGVFDATAAADGLMSMMRGYGDEIQYVRTYDVKTSADIKAEWEMVKSTGRIKAQRNDRSVAPLVDVTWNQNAYYNDHCPEDPDGPNGHVYAGCVATAMAQVMKYWNYPETGTGSHSYTPGGWGPYYPTQTANFGETDYHFELMPDFLDSTSTEEEIFYVAQLQHHCGVAVEMMYAPDGSGAYSEDVPYAIENYFNYSNTTNMRYKDSYNNEEWAEMLKEELDAGRPLYYSGSDDAGQGAHAFVCDGYDEFDFFHFNWGWGKRDDGYFAIGAMNTTRYAFNTWNAAIFDWCPRDAEYFNRPEKVENVIVVESDDNSSVTVQWTNPILTLDGNALTTIDSVFVRRDFQVIASFANVTPGESMSFVDEGLEPDLYEYSVLVKNEAGFADTEYLPVLVGEKCDVIFQINDVGNNGWKGASSSVVESGRRISVVTLEDGGEESLEIPLLKGELSFYWNGGWFSGMDDNEISFTIYDADNNELFASPDSLVQGFLFSFNNDCEGNLCIAPNNLQGEYQWNNDQSFGALLSWSLSADFLTGFNVYRSIDNENYSLIASVEANPSTTDYEYFDDDMDVPDTYYYKVCATYLIEGESCESTPATTSEGDTFVMLNITSTGEMSLDGVSIYPNPTDGKIMIMNGDITSVEVYDIVGHVIMNIESEGDDVIVDMTALKNGVYFIHVMNETGCMTKRVVLNRYKKFFLI